MSERESHLGEPFDDDAPSGAPPAEADPSAPAEPAVSAEPAVTDDTPSSESATSAPAYDAGSRSAHEVAPNMLPGRPSRGSGFERGVVRVIATGGVIGIGVGIAAILAANSVQGWIIGLVVSTLSVILSAVLWSSRQL